MGRSKRQEMSNSQQHRFRGETCKDCLHPDKHRFCWVIKSTVADESSACVYWEKNHINKENE